MSHIKAFDAKHDRNWWVCPACRRTAVEISQLRVKLDQLHADVTRVLDMNAKLININTDLQQKVQTLTESNETLTAKLKSLSDTNQRESKERALKDATTLLVGDSTKRDIKSTNHKSLTVNPRGGAKTWDILSILKKMQTDRGCYPC